MTILENLGFHKSYNLHKFIIKNQNQPRKIQHTHTTVPIPPSNTRFFLPRTSSADSHQRPRQRQIQTSIPRATVTIPTTNGSSGNASPQQEIKSSGTAPERGESGILNPRVSSVKSNVRCCRRRSVSAWFDERKLSVRKLRRECEV
ncbi:hypothetical protein M758_2G062400 [Ceratodon purpureus]|nr:hypothetical protein M758_2G062400 [Ceratodon purpureus]